MTSDSHEAKHEPALPDRLCFADIIDDEGFLVVRFIGSPQDVADAASIYMHNVENPLGGFPEDSIDLDREDSS